MSPALPRHSGQSCAQPSRSSLDRVVKTTCFLADLDDYPAFNAVYGRYFAVNPPPRSTVHVAKLPLGSLVEVECIALTS